MSSSLGDHDANADFPIIEAAAHRSKRRRARVCGTRSSKRVFPRCHPLLSGCGSWRPVTWARRFACLAIEHALGLWDGLSAFLVRDALADPSEDICGVPTRWVEEKERAALRAQTRDVSARGGSIQIDIACRFFGRSRLKAMATADLWFGDPLVGRGFTSDPGHFDVLTPRCATLSNSPQGDMEKPVARPAPCSRSSGGLSTRGGRRYLDGSTPTTLSPSMSGAPARLWRPPWVGILVGPAIPRKSRPLLPGRCGMACGTRCPKAGAEAAPVPCPGPETGPGPLGLDDLPVH